MTSAVMMRRMTSVSPYRHWHFFDAYPPGFLRAVYRANGIPLPWGNMSVVPIRARAGRCSGCSRTRAPDREAAQKPKSQISIMPDGDQPRLYCCHSMLTATPPRVSHVLSVGVDLSPALSAQGYDEALLVESGGGGLSARAVATRRFPPTRRMRCEPSRRYSNIGWIGDALTHEATTICSRSNHCPRPPHACH